MTFGPTIRARRDPPRPIARRGACTYAQDARAAKKPRRDGGDDDEADSECDEGLSGDEVDPSLIIAGGRSSRRGRATFTANYSYGPSGAGDDDESSEDDA